MSNAVKYTLLGILSFLAFMGSMIALYLVIQATHPDVTPMEWAYQSCLLNTDSKLTEKCNYLDHQQAPKQ